MESRNRSNEIARSFLRRIVSCSKPVYVYDRDEIFCRCQKLVPRDTSWTDSNPGRRFYGCPNYRRGGGCNFFRWYDNKLDSRCEELLIKFRDSEQYLAKENSRLSMGITSDSIRSLFNNESVQNVSKLANYCDDECNGLEVRLKKKLKRCKIRCRKLEKENLTYKILLLLASVWIAFSFFV